MEIHLADSPSPVTCHAAAAAATTVSRGTLPSACLRLAVSAGALQFPSEPLSPLSSNPADFLGWHAPVGGWLPCSGSGHEDTDDDYSASETGDLPVDASAPATSSPCSSCQRLLAYSARRHKSDLFLPNEVVDGRYQVVHKLGSGGFAVVYCCRDLYHPDRQEVALKLVQHSVVAAGGSLPAKLRWLEVLDDELAIYQQLGCCGDLDDTPAGLPSILAYGRQLRLPVAGCTSGCQHVFSYIAMPVLGPDVNDISARGAYERDVHLFIRHGIGMLKALESMHNKGLVHGDVKPDNFCIVAPAVAYAGSAAHSSSPSSIQRNLHDMQHHHHQEQEVSILDMGFAHAWAAPHLVGVDYENVFGKSPGLHYRGTPDYSSIRSLLGYPLTPRDDLESLGQVLLEMSLPHMPWRLTTDAEAEAGWTNARLHEMASIKQEIIARELAQNKLPAWFLCWHNHIANASPISAMEYGVLEGILRSAAGPCSSPPHHAYNASAAAAAEPFLPHAPSSDHRKRKARPDQHAGAAAAAEEAAGLPVASTSHCVPLAAAGGHSVQDSEAGSKRHRRERLPQLPVGSSRYAPLVLHASRP